MADPIDTRALLSLLGDQFEELHNERDRLAARVAELENPFNLTDEQKTARKLLADRIEEAANILPEDEFDRQLAFFLETFARNLRAGAHFSPILCRRADKLAAVLLDEEN